MTRTTVMASTARIDDEVPQTSPVEAATSLSGTTVASHDDRGAIPSAWSKDLRID